MSGKGKRGKGQKKKRQYQIEREGISDFLCNAVGYDRGDGTPPMPPLGQPAAAVGNNVDVSLQPAQGNGGALVDLSAEQNEAAASSSPHDMGRPCPKLSEPQYGELLYQVEKVVEAHNGHLEYDPSSGTTLEKIWFELIFPKLFDPKTGVLGRIHVKQPNGQTAPKNWRKKYLNWLTEVIENHEADVRMNPSLATPPCVDKARQQLRERSASAQHGHSSHAGTKKRQKEAENANLEAYAQRMGLENDGGRRPTKRLQAAGLCYGQRADHSAVDPNKKIPRHEDHVKGLSDEIKGAQKIEEKLNAILEKGVGIGNLDDDLQRINLIGATIKSLNEQAKGYKENDLEVPAWIVAQIKDLEKEQQDIFKARRNHHHQH